MSERENPKVTAPSHRATLEDIRTLAGAATPHFALQIRNRLRRLVAPLDHKDAARVLAEREIARLDELAVEGETRGPSHADERRVTG